MLPPKKKKKNKTRSQGDAYPVSGMLSRSPFEMLPVSGWPWVRHHHSAVTHEDRSTVVTYLSISLRKHCPYFCPHSCGQKYGQSFRSDMDKRVPVSPRPQRRACRGKPYGKAIYFLSRPIGSILGLARALYMKLFIAAAGRCAACGRAAAAGRCAAHKRSFIYRARARVKLLPRGLCRKLPAFSRW